MLNSALQLLRDDLPKFGKKALQRHSCWVKFDFSFTDSGAHKLPLNGKLWMELGFRATEKSLEFWAQQCAAHLPAECRFLKR